jgi:hypothetical protein
MLEARKAIRRQTSTQGAAVTVALPGAFAQVTCLGCRCGYKSVAGPPALQREHAWSASGPLRIASVWCSSKSSSVQWSPSSASCASWPVRSSSSRDGVRLVASLDEAYSPAMRPNDRTAGVPLSGGRAARSFSE